MRQGQAESLVSRDILEASTCCELERRVWSIDWQVTESFVNTARLYFYFFPLGQHSTQLMQ
jgi:hypothetical protein